MTVKSKKASIKKLWIKQISIIIQYRFFFFFLNGNNTKIWPDTSRRRHLFFQHRSFQRISSLWRSNSRAYMSRVSFRPPPHLNNLNYKKNSRVPLFRTIFKFFKGTDFRHLFSSTYSGKRVLSIANKKNPLWC